MVLGLIITGVFLALFIYLGYRDWHNSNLSGDDSRYIKYSSPELYIISIMGIFIGVFISFELMTTLVVILTLLPICYIVLKIISPYFDFLPPRS